MSEKLTWQLVRGRSLLSRTIGYWGAEYYSHIDVLTPQNALRGARSDVLGGIPAGYEDRPQGYEKWATCTRYTIEIPLGTWVKYWDFSDRQLHKPYDKHGLIGGFVFGRDWRENDSWWCSEEVAANGEFAGLWTIPPEKKWVTPGDCMDLFVGMGAERVEIPC